jgi:hypothetical protein
MIVQVGSARFEVPTAPLVVPLPKPSLRGSVIAVAFTLITAAATIVRVTDSGSPRGWKVANDTTTGNGRRVCWVRVGGPPGVVEVVGESANSTLVSGTAMALEAQAHPGAALQLLADLLLEVA